jgi:hypothetical protein
VDGEGGGGVKPASQFLDIPCAIYRVHVVVTWGTTIAEIARYAFRHHVRLSLTWIKTVEQEIGDGGCSGCTFNFGDGNTDILVWLRTRPKKASNFGTLYHELYHATRAIAESHSFVKEEEAQAFLYEHLATACNRVLWNARR